MSLTEDLLAKKNAGIANIPAEKYQVMKGATEALIEQKLSNNALKTGDQMLNFELPNSTDNLVSFKDLKGEGSLVISFYRGGWCPYCNLELKALQNVLPQLKELNTNLVAITPETPDNSLTTSEKNELSFEVLSDIDNSFAKELGLVFKMPDDLVDVYNEFNLDIEKYNGNKNFELPMPATYVVDNSGKITYSFVPEDYTQRLDPEDILKALK